MSMLGQSTQAMLCRFLRFKKLARRCKWYVILFKRSTPQGWQKAGDLAHLWVPPGCRSINSQQFYSYFCHSPGKDVLWIKCPSVPCMHAISPKGSDMLHCLSQTQTCMQLWSSDRIAASRQSLCTDNLVCCASQQGDIDAFAASNEQASCCGLL